MSSTGIFVLILVYAYHGPNVAGLVSRLPVTKVSFPFMASPFFNDLISEIWKFLVALL